MPASGFREPEYGPAFPWRRVCPGGGAPSPGTTTSRPGETRARNQIPVETRPPKTESRGSSACRPGDKYG